MKQQVWITFAIVILVVVLIVSGGICTYVSNQTEIQQGVERLLDERINEYVEKNKTEFVASLTPVIGMNGNWWIGDTDTGCPVTVEGQPGMSAYAIAVANGFQGTEVEWLNSLQGSNGADGSDGQTPYIGDNGNWWIGDTDTDVKASTENPVITYSNNIVITDVWKKTGIHGDSLLKNGLYAYKVHFDASGTAGIWEETLGGTLNWFCTYVNGNGQADLVPGNMAGHAKNNNTIQLRVFRNISGDLDLEIRGSVANSSAIPCVFIFKKLI